MNSSKSTPRLLGAAFLIVFVASILSDVLLSSAIGSDHISEILVNVAANPTLMRISILVELTNCVGIVVLAAMLYVAFREYNEGVALTALGLYLAEAITLAVSKIGACALIPLSLQFVEAGAPESSFYQALGNLLYYGLDRQGYHIHVFFFCLGGILWYYLFYKTRYIPRIISVWGLASISLVLVNTLLVLYGLDLGHVGFVVALYLPFEPAIGLWLMVKGRREGSESR